MRESLPEQPPPMATDRPPEVQDLLDRSSKKAKRTRSYAEATKAGLPEIGNQESPSAAAELMSLESMQWTTPYGNNEQNPSLATEQQESRNVQQPSENLSRIRTQNQEGNKQPTQEWAQSSQKSFSQPVHLSQVQQSSRGGYRGGRRGDFPNRAAGAAEHTVVRGSNKGKSILATIKREQNQPADALAKIAIRLPRGIHIFSAPPNELLGLLEDDAMAY
nr:RING-H2 finger protein ATL67-like [Ipomoea batatas]